MKLTEIARDLDSNEYDPEGWLRRGSLASILSEIKFHTEFRFWQFTPTQTGTFGFFDRLVSWIQNANLTDKDKSLLLRLVPQIQFIDRDDMLALYRGAFNEPIRRWIMDKIELDFRGCETSFSESLAKGIAETWFCPVTDSMNIAQFHHANGIAGKDFRPSWRTLRKFGDVDAIKSHMAQQSLRRLVLLEDFVGSGRQSIPVLQYAVKHLCPEIPVLFVPLALSELGEINIRSGIGEPEGFTLEPLFKIPLQSHVQEIGQDSDSEFAIEIRELVHRTFEQVRIPSPPETEHLDHAFGFGSVGTLLVMYTNCPNNTLPIVWHQSPEWNALFPRVSRF